MYSRRITVSMPANIVKELKERIPKGEQSSFITSSVRKSLFELKFKSNLKKDSMQLAKELRERLKIRLSNEDIIKSINKGREPHVFT